MYKFNVPFRSGETIGILDKNYSCKLSMVGGGANSKNTEKYLIDNFGYEDCILTSSCTDAIEIAAQLYDLKEGDHIIAPAFTFVTSVLPFAKFTKNITFVDCELDDMNVSIDKYKEAIQKNTKLIISVNYAGSNKYMPLLSDFCKRAGIFLFEDAAQSLGAKYKDKYFGGFGDLSAISFHDTKNLNSGGEGGCLVINNTSFADRARILSEKGTNRHSFIIGNVNKYEWLDYGSSHVMSDLNAAILYSHLQSHKNVTEHRRNISEAYKFSLRNTKLRHGPIIDNNISENGHIIFLLLENKFQRSDLQKFLLSRGVESTTHYLDLSCSPFAVKHLKSNELCKNATIAENCLLRLPIHYDIKVDQVIEICNYIKEWSER